MMWWKVMVLGLSCYRTLAMDITLVNVVGILRGGKFLLLFCRTEWFSMGHVWTLERVLNHFSLVRCDLLVRQASTRIHFGLAVNLVTASTNDHIIMLLAFSLTLVTTLVLILVIVFYVAQWYSHIFLLFKTVWTYVIAVFSPESLWITRFIWSFLWTCHFEELRLIYPHPININLLSQKFITHLRGWQLSPQHLLKLWIKLFSIFYLLASCRVDSDLLILYELIRCHHILHKLSLLWSLDSSPPYSFRWVCLSINIMVWPFRWRFDPGRFLTIATQTWGRSAINPLRDFG